MFVPFDDDSAPAGAAPGATFFPAPVGFSPPGLLSNPMFGGGSRNPLFVPPAASQADTHVDYHTQDYQKFAQYLSDTNVRFAMFNSETTTKANIVNVLTKLEDKYQVRG